MLGFVIFGELSFGSAPLGVAEHTECLRNAHPRAGGGIRTMVCLPYAPWPVPSTLLREGGCATRAPRTPSVV